MSVRKHQIIATTSTPSSTSAEQWHLLYILYVSPIKKSDWGTLVPRFNVENIRKLGFVLE
jgi:hypothetical protein